MASIKKRPNGQWRARYRDDAGKEHARHFTRKVDAQRWLDEVTTSMVTGQYVDPRAGRVTFRAYAEDWRKAAPHGPAMRVKVARDLDAYVYPTFGERPIASIRFTHVQSWVTTLPLAPSTVAVLLSRMSSIMRAAVRDRVITTNPTVGVKPPDHRRNGVWIPNLDQVWALREGLPPRFRAVVDLVAGAGLRQGEVFGLEVSGLDFLRARAVTVTQQLVTLPPAQLFLGPPKTEESHRTVPLAQPTLDVLARHLSEFPPSPQAVSDRINPHSTKQRDATLVFTTGKQTPMARGQWSHLWAPAARAAGFPPRAGLHALRHFYASALIRHGESAKVVQRRLGHSSAAFTLDTYTHLWPDSDDRTREAVTSALHPRADSERTADPTQGV